MRPEKVCLLIGACAIFQKIAIMFNEPDDDGDYYHQNEQLAVEAYVGHGTGNQIKAHITNDF